MQQQQQAAAPGGPDCPPPAVGGNGATPPQQFLQTALVDPSGGWAGLSGRGGHPRHRALCSGPCVPRSAPPSATPDSSTNMLLSCEPAPAASANPSRCRPHQGLPDAACGQLAAPGRRPQVPRPAGVRPAVAAADPPPLPVLVRKPARVTVKPCVVHSPSQHTSRLQHQCTLGQWLPAMPAGSTPGFCKRGWRSSLPVSLSLYRPRHLCPLACLSHCA